MIQRMLAIWSLVPLSFLKAAWTPGSSRFTSFCLPDFKVIKQHIHTSLTTHTHTHTHTHTLPSLRFVFLPYWTGVFLSTHVTPHFLSHFCSLGDSKAQRIGIESIQGGNSLAVQWLGLGTFTAEGLRFPPVGVAVFSALSSTVLMGKLLCPSVRVCSVVSRSLWLHRLQPARLLCPWNFPGKSNGVGCHFLLQEIEPKFPASLAWAGWFLTTEQLGSPLCPRASSIAWQGRREARKAMRW